MATVNNVSHRPLNYSCIMADTPKYTDLNHRWEIKMQHFRKLLVLFIAFKSKAPNENKVLLKN